MLGVKWEGRALPKWKLCALDGSLKPFEAEWQSLKKNISSDHPLLEFDFVEPLVKQLEAEKLFLAKLWESEYKGVAILKKRRFGTWETFAPGPAPIGFLMVNAPTRATVNSCIAGLMKSLPGCAIMLGVCRLDPDVPTLNALYDDPHFEVIEYIHTIRIDTDMPFDSYWAKRSQNLRSDIRKRLRLIEKEPLRVKLNELKSPESIYEGVKIHGELESKGWKGGINTHIDINNWRGRFYADMLERFARRGHATIYQLTFDDTVVASMLTVSGNGMIVLLKTAFDEKFARFSPGWILMYELYRILFSLGGKLTIEHYGRAYQKLRQWGGNVRIMYHANYYRFTFLKSWKENLRKLSQPSGDSPAGEE